jgi:hypothetical protein
MVSDVVARRQLGESRGIRPVFKSSPQLMRKNYIRFSCVLRASITLAFENARKSLRTNVLMLRAQLLPNRPPG